MASDLQYGNGRGDRNAQLGVDVLYRGDYRRHSRFRRHFRDCGWFRQGLLFHLPGAVFGVTGGAHCSPGLTRGEQMSKNIAVFGIYASELNAEEGVEEVEP